ncbi:MAG: iron ABC transporter permease [Actinomycetota bacterium]
MTATVPDSTPGAETSEPMEPMEPSAGVERSRSDRARELSWPIGSLTTAALVVIPIAFLSVSILRPNVDVWRQQWSTRLPGQLLDTALLLVGVSIGSLLLGCSLAWLVSAYRFPGSRFFGWALIAPLAMPSYVLGFVVLSVIGFTGPVQGWWRDTFGEDAWFPDVSSLGGAIVVFSLVLYPYVFLLARTALADVAGNAYDVARSLGAGPVEAARRVMFPLLRPAIAAGVAVVMMETLTDFATVQYFGVDTITVGVFRIWRGTFDRDAASEFATLVLVVALMIIGLERVLRGRARFGQAAGAASGLEPRRLSGSRGWAATAVCTTVLLVAFGAPTIQLAAWALSERGAPQLRRFPEFLSNSLILAVLTAATCLLAAIVVTNGARFGHRRANRLAARLTAIGYAVPGPVVAIGVVLALVALDDVLEVIGLGLPGAVATGSLVGLVYAYSVRFLAPGLTTLEAGLAQVPDEVTASARSLGARPGTIVGRIHLPLTRTSVVTGTVLVAIDALKELPIALLLRPIGFNTLSIWTYNLATESLFELAALPALTIVAVALATVAILGRELARSAAHD